MAHQRVSDRSVTKILLPNNPADIATVQAIDATISLCNHSSRRTGCTNDEVLAIGHTHQPDYRVILIELAALVTIDRIEQLTGE